MQDTKNHDDPVHETWVPDERARFATRPTGFTCFMRVFFPYQLWRFAMINLKMMRVIRRGHSGSRK